MALELGYLNENIYRTIEYIKMTVNISSGTARTTCNFTLTDDSLRKSLLDFAQGNYLVFDGNDELYRGVVESVDINYQTGVVKVATERELTAGTLLTNLKKDLRSILSQPPLNETFLLHNGILDPLVEELTLGGRSRDEMIQECYRHNIIIDNVGKPSSIAKVSNTVILGEPNAYTATATINNYHHTPIEVVNGRILVRSVEETASGLVTTDFFLGSADTPIIFRDTREAPSPGWAHLYAKESERRIIRESAQLKVTLPLTPKITPNSGILLLNRITTAAGLSGWVTETVSHSLSGDDQVTTLNCKVFFSN